MGLVTIDLRQLVDRLTAFGTSFGRPIGSHTAER